MNKFSLAALAACTVLATPLFASPPPGSWTMTLDDEFNGSALNTAVWSTGMRWDAVINNELEAYTPSNVTVANGLCTLKVEKRTANNIDMYGDVGQQQSYASGCLQTYTKWAQKYGYWEASIRMSPGLGTWPAFWLLPDRGSSYSTSERVLVGNDGNGMGNEIDIVEFMSAWTGQNSQGLFESHSGYFWGYGSGQSTGNYGQSNGGIGPVNLYSNATSQFHTYGVCWQPGSLTYYLDGNVILRRSDPNDISTVPEYMILNCALSTNQWFGSALTTAQIDAGLPCTMDIDWVRVYSGTASPSTQYDVDNLTIPNYKSAAGGTAREFADSNFANGNGIILDSNNVGDYVTFLVPNVAAGRYDVSVHVKDYYSRGQFQLQVGRADNFSGTESNVGPVIDEYSASTSYPVIDLGAWAPGTTSDKWFRFNVVGKNSASSGSSYNYAISFDYILLTPE